MHLKGEDKYLIGNKRNINFRTAPLEIDQIRLISIKAALNSAELQPEFN